MQRARVKNLLLAWALLVLLLLICLMACSTNNAETSFTLSTGVHLQSAIDVNKDIENAVEVKKEAAGYEFHITAYFSDDLAPPYLTLSNNHRASLVLLPKNAQRLFASSAETGRIINIKVEGRLQAGDTVYIVNNHEVIGHVVLP